ncbi:hypothetical protein HYE67_009673 [Fusarium culmorum]|uniref:Uncharacterized protein n=1 Tax=Fusarium culmorum TaxID=5516 RepID=A0A2T4H7L5_FUSCU|nr:hypothetical protein FCULG_00004601 [Fusarium culmorum]QPC67442.1 hypothetical protein HYE67_009673 [Fusarium culmorum]
MLDACTGQPWMPNAHLTHCTGYYGASTVRGGSGVVAIRAELRPSLTSHNSSPRIRVHRVRLGPPNPGVNDPTLAGLTSLSFRAQSGDGLLSPPSYRRWTTGMAQ